MIRYSYKPTLYGNIEKKLDKAVKKLKKEMKETEKNGKIAELAIEFRWCIHD